MQYPSFSSYQAFWRFGMPIKNGGGGTLIGGAKKRILTLGVPYVIWNCVASAFFIALEFYNTGSIPSISFTFILKCLFNHQYNGPLWYVQKLLIYSWLAPILYYVIRNRFGFYIAVVVLTLQHIFLHDCLPGLVFYIIGAGMALHAKNRINYPQKNAITACALVVFVITQLWRIAAFDAAVLIEVARRTIQYRMIEYLGPIALWFAVDMLPFAKMRVLRVERETFAVYVTHIMTLSLVTSTVVNRILRLPTTSLLYAVFMFFVTPLVIYLITVLIAGKMKKLMPNVYRIAMGGR